MSAIRFCTCGIAERAHPTEGCPGFEPDTPDLHVVLGTQPAVGALSATSEPASEMRRTSWSASELLNAEFKAPRFAVDGLIPEGLAFMCGAPKLGKSWLALGLSIAVAGGGMALGSVQVERGETLYLALEDSPRRLQSRLRILLADDHAPHGLQIETAWPRLNEGAQTRSSGGSKRTPALASC
jgi:hypothetical protein